MSALPDVLQIESRILDAIYPSGQNAPLTREQIGTTCGVLVEILITMMPALSLQSQDVILGAIVRTVAEARAAKRRH